MVACMPPDQALEKRDELFGWFHPGEFGARTLLKAAWSQARWKLPNRQFPWGQARQLQKWHGRVGAGAAWGWREMGRFRPDFAPDIGHLLPIRSPPQFSNPHRRLLLPFLLLPPDLRRRTDRRRNYAVQLLGESSSSSSPTASERRSSSSSVRTSKG